MSTLIAIKDTDIEPLKFEAHGYKPLEYERWILSVERVMDGYHPEVAMYFRKILDQTLDIERLVRTGEIKEQCAYRSDIYGPDSVSGNDACRPGGQGG